MKPKVRPARGWRFRIILCDDRGNHVFDDFLHERDLRPGFEKLLMELEEMRAKEEEEGEE